MHKCIATIHRDVVAWSTDKDVHPKICILTFLVDSAVSVGWTIESIFSREAVYS